ncbi:hypothetical protein D1007_31833 [Hordeum vulgare]|nr:hypothetical protein D1007_31833 [Hordeum vulgare]
MPVFCYVCGYMGHTNLEHGNGKHDKASMAWRDWILAPRPGSESQIPRHNFPVVQKPNPQGRAEGDNASTADLKDDANSPLKTSGGNTTDGDRTRKRLTYDDPATNPSRERLPLLMGTTANGIAPMELHDPSRTGEEGDEDDASSQDSKRSKTGPGERRRELFAMDGSYQPRDSTISTWTPVSATIQELEAWGRFYMMIEVLSWQLLVANIPFVEDVSSAEARGLRDGLILANEMGLEKIVVESDCMDVVDIMLNGGNSLGPAAAIYEECSFLAKNFSYIQFQFCPREANKVGDLLASNAESTRTIKWPEEPPGFLIDVLANDVTLLSHEI